MVLVHIFRGFSPWLAVPKQKHHCRKMWQRNDIELLAARKQRERGRTQEERSRDQTWSHARDPPRHTQKFVLLF